MQESVTFIAHVYKTGIETRHKFLYLGNVNVAHGEVSRTWFILIFNQPFVLKQGNRNLFWLNVDNYFACHFLLIIIENTIIFPLLLIIKKGARHCEARPLSEQSPGLTCSYDGSYVISFYAYA